MPTACNKATSNCLTGSKLTALADPATPTAGGLCPELTGEERAALEQSAQVLRDAAQTALDSLDDR